MLTGRREFLDAMVVPVGDENVVILVHRNPPRTGKLPVAVAFRAEASKVLAVGGETLHPVVQILCDEKLALAVEG